MTLRIPTLSTLFHRSPTTPIADPGANPDTDPGAALLPPLDILQQGENLLAQFRSDRGLEPELLVVTNHRLLRAAALGTGQSFVLDQADTTDLTSVVSKRVGPDLMTTALLRGRTAIRVVGGDPERSRAFVTTVSRLLSSGRFCR